MSSNQSKKLQYLMISISMILNYISNVAGNDVKL